MKVGILMKIMFLVVLVTTLILGCGGENKVGGLTLAVTTEDPAGASFVVSANATYTHPTITELVNVPITFDTVPSGLVSGFPRTIYTNTSGNAGVLMTFTQKAAPLTLTITATTGDLQDSKSVTVPVQNTLIATPTSVTFLPADPIGTTKTVAISGGSGGTLTAVSSDPVNIAATITGTTLTITKLTAVTGATAIVTVSDTVSFVQIGVEY